MKLLLVLTQVKSKALRVIVFIIINMIILTTILMFSELIKFFILVTLKNYPFGVTTQVVFIFLSLFSLYNYWDNRDFLERLTNN